jgi:hypothetical protein
MIWPTPVFIEPLEIFKGTELIPFCSNKKATLRRYRAGMGEWSVGLVV